MLINQLRHFILLGIFVRRFEDSIASMTFSNGSLVRSGRDVGTKYLVFPQGSNVQLVYCLTISGYTKPEGLFTVSAIAGLAWELPYRNTLQYGKPAEVYHRRSRRELYRKAELMLRTLPSDTYLTFATVAILNRDYCLADCKRAYTQGKDGKACVLKAICKAAGRRREDVGKGSFLEEILHAIFTLPGGWYDIDPMTEYERTYHLSENCDEVHAKCPGVF